MRQKQPQPTEAQTFLSRRHANGVSKLIADLMVAALKQGNLECLTLLGLTPLHATKLRNLRFCDQHRLQKMYSDCVKCFRIEVDPIRLESTLNHLINADSDEAVIDHMLYLGASQAVMRALCGLRHEDTVARRRVLGIEASQGRARRPDIETRLAIAMQWQQLGAVERDPRQRLIRVAELSGHSIATLFSVLQEANVPLDAETPAATIHAQPSTPSQHSAVQVEAPALLLPLE